MEMYRSSRIKNKSNNNLRMKASSLYFLNDIGAGIDAVDGPDNPDNWRDSYTFNPMIIGRGHFSKVYKVKCCSSGNNAAIKIIRRRRLGTDKIDEIMQEIEIMQLLNKSSNSAFIQLLKVHTTPSEVALVMEFAAGGSLYHVTQESQSGLPEVYVKIVLTKIMSALSYLHRQDIVHLDIKADNILLRYPYQSTDVILIDFGLARRLTKSKVHKEMIGTPDYIAPEVLNYEQICLKSDIWSVGVLAYFLLTNISPFSGDSKDDTLNRVTKSQFEFIGSLKEENMYLARHFISALLVRAPECRLSADESMSHDFLNNVPIIECSSDKSSSQEAPIINLEYKVQVRPNPSYQTRGLVMSQYDICSSDMNDDSLTNCDTIVMANSLDCLDGSRISEKAENEPIGVNISQHSIDQINEEFVTCDVKENEVVEEINAERGDHGKEKMPIDMVICEIMNSSANDFDEEETFGTDGNEEEEKVCDCVNDLLIVDNNCEECIEYCQASEMPLEDNSDKVQIETTTLVFESTHCDNDKEETGEVTEKDAVESSNVTLKNCHHKVNLQYHDNDVKPSINRSNTLICDSRHRLHATTNHSFRHSRENLIGTTILNGDNHCSPIQRDNILNTRTLSSVVDRTLPAVHRRIHMSRSLKRDFDKPHDIFDKWNRRSQIEPVMKPMWDDNGTLDNNYDFIKSNPTLHSTKSLPKKPQSKIERMFSHWKPKKNSQCAIS